MVGTVANGKLVALSTKVSYYKLHHTISNWECRSSITRSFIFARKIRHLGFNVKFPNFLLLMLNQNYQKCVGQNNICRLNQAHWFLTNGLVLCVLCWRSGRGSDDIPWVSQRGKGRVLLPPWLLAPPWALALPPTHYSMTRVKLFLLSKAS